MGVGFEEAEPDLCLTSLTSLNLIPNRYSRMFFQNKPRLFSTALQQVHHQFEKPKEYSSTAAHVRHAEPTEPTPAVTGKVPITSRLGPKVQLASQPTPSGNGNLSQKFGKIGTAGEIHTGRTHTIPVPSAVRITVKTPFGTVDRRSFDVPDYSADAMVPVHQEYSKPQGGAQKRKIVERYEEIVLSSGKKIRRKIEPGQFYLDTVLTCHGVLYLSCFADDIDMGSDSIEKSRMIQTHQVPNRPAPSGPRHP